MHKVTDIFISFILFTWGTLNWIYATRITGDIQAFYSLKEVIIYIVVLILYLIIQVFYINKSNIIIERNNNNLVYYFKKFIEY